MKRPLALVFIVAMIFSLTACSKNKDIEIMDGDGFEAGVDNDDDTLAENSNENDLSITEQVRVENGRLSAIEPPEGWLEGESLSENQLIYKFKHDMYTEYPEDAPEVTIDIDEYDTPEEKIASTKILSEDWDEEYKTGETTIGGIDFLTFDSQSQTFTAMFGTKDGVTLSISVSTRLGIDNPDVITIIDSVRVASE